MIGASLFCLVTVNLAAGDELRPLFRAIRAIETSGIRAPDRQVGDNGRSIGPYQVSLPYWVDSGVGGLWIQCHGRSYSEAVMLGYWKRHCPEALQQRNLEVLARIHNGGPNGHVKGATSIYWRKVERMLAREKSPDFPRLAARA